MDWSSSLLTVVVDDLLFASNNHSFLSHFKNISTEKFDVKLYVTIKSFIRWKISRDALVIKVDQEQYLFRVLHLFDMKSFNTVFSPIGVKADLRPSSCIEQPLNPR